MTSQKHHFDTISTRCHGSVVGHLATTSQQEVKARGAEALELELPFDEAMEKSLQNIAIDIVGFCMVSVAFLTGLVMLCLASDGYFGGSSLKRKNIHSACDSFFA